MNYRHAFHAGNHADVLKHLVLARVLAHLGLKDKPFRALDAFAGLGVYDLTADEAARTGEWRDGWGRMEAPFAPDIEALLAPYRETVAAVQTRYGATAYPGAAVVIREALRPGDRGVFVELHPEDAATLRGRYERDGRTKVLSLDGWTAVNAQIPPPERRGLVLIDPPYEVPGEIERLGSHLARAVAKWPTGIFLAWYPIKDAAAIDRMVRDLDAALPRPALRLDLLIDRPDDPTRLCGSGLIVVNPPWRLAEEALLFLPALAQRLAREEFGGFRCDSIGPAS
ncbi:lactate dehydrogenase [Methylobacterium sp. GXS13]|uniref:23S rRNA (adenine(2030)-N(6))-methyltransferase RlmJ n=1 Tax=Methylobacterium sp. GXS13 TaxID=1730094 RepID=UPI00071B8959|nr:23S rRNA (adenine(2030)-N(6))-methyltransferase RlmJ [Methylobacterium sp. GXS13]KST60311.1 lactate dehydrogenase [Methylobacterium sp. GXS13]